VSGDKQTANIQQTQKATNNMKNTYKLVLAAALGLAGVTGAQAGDLYLGFNDLAGPPAAQNDYVVDLGNVAGFTTTSYNVISFSATTFNTAFGADSIALTSSSHVAAGVAGGQTSSFSSLAILAQTAPNGGLPTWNAVNNSVFADSVNLAQAANTGEYQSSGEFNRTGAYGWSEVIAQSPTLQGTDISGNLAGNTANPTAYLSSGLVTEQLYESTGTGVRGSTPSAWTDVGTLIINANNDTVTYFGSAVPEPSVYGLVAGAGLLIVALRRPMTAKKS
jgi:hypothetical protein